MECVNILFVIIFGCKFKVIKIGVFIDYFISEVSY